MFEGRLLPARAFPAVFALAAFLDGVTALANGAGGHTGTGAACL